jgi:hypothetical protein
MIFVSAQRGKDTKPGTFPAPLREIAKAIEQSAAGETVRRSRQRRLQTVRSR